MCADLDDAGARGSGRLPGVFPNDVWGGMGNVVGLFSQGALRRSW